MEEFWEFYWEKTINFVKLKGFALVFSNILVTCRLKCEKLVTKK